MLLVPKCADGSTQAYTSERFEELRSNIEPAAAIVATSPESTLLPC
jgi:hypothetical protein